MEALGNKPRSRRSRPSLGALHITPLTHAPLGESPMLDDEYDAPSGGVTPQDGRRRSYLSPRSLPQTPSILSRSPSRTRNSRGHRSNKSALALTSIDDESLFGPATTGGSHALSSGSRSARPKSAMASGRQTPARVRIADHESTDFLLRTASMLVESATESKGQGWISKRNSSTSLTNYEMPQLQREEKEKAYGADDEFSATWSRRESRRNSMSLPGSRRGSRRGSRAMMAGLASGHRTPGSSTPRTGYFEEMGLDMAEEDGDWREDDEDEETIDEGELRRLLRRRVGGFFEDVFGGWFDLRGEDGEASDDDEEQPSEVNVDDTAQASKVKKQRFAGIRKNDIVSVQPASEKPGIFGDARWLLTLARNILV